MQSTSHPSARHGAATIYREISDFTHTAPAPALHESTSPENIRLTQTNDVWMAVQVLGTWDVDEISSWTDLPAWNIRRALDALGLVPMVWKAKVKPAENASTLERVKKALAGIKEPLTVRAIASKAGVTSASAKWCLKIHALAFVKSSVMDRGTVRNAWRLA